KIVRQLKKRKIEFLATSKGENRNPDCENSKYISMTFAQKRKSLRYFTLFFPLMLSIPQQ
ncbi:MAG: hypothetical protein ACKO7P_01370, partial [Bacteroidota bacterium]